MTAKEGRTRLGQKVILSHSVVPVYRALKSAYLATGLMLYKYSYNIGKSEFIEDLRSAIEGNRGYATGKIGNSEQYWMYYPIVLSRERDGPAVAKYERGLEHHFLKNTGLFPCTPEFILDFNRFYIEQVRNLDCLGVFDYFPREWRIVRHYGLRTKLTHWLNQEPDRATPDVERGCYLPFFAGKRILIVCPFAGLLKERATQEIYEGVWSKLGKKWFHPKSVDALEFHYGFSPETQQKYGTAFNLFEHITGEIDRRDFDVALIAAAGLAIPIASHMKKLGKVGISLGGFLQVMFGVLGKRWKRWDSWWVRYFNDWWIDMPAHYKPKETDVCDCGAYW